MSLYIKENPVYFRTALESIIHQTIKPDEIVLVEDGPLTKELYQIIDEYKSFLHLVVNDKNMGLGIALQKGLEACNNELVARMDTDDISVADRFEKQLRYFELHPDTAILGGQIDEFIDDSSKVVGRRIVPETDEDIKNYMRKRCPFNHTTVMFKKSAVLAADNYQDWFCNEDYYLWIRLALKEQIFANLPETLVKVRVGKDMYTRRGGDKYFKSEIGIQKLMLENGIIDMPTFVLNCAKRLVVQKILPNNIRGWVFKTFARE